MQPGGEMAVDGGPERDDSGSLERRRRQPGGGGPWPHFKLGDGAGMEEVLWP